MRYLSVQRTVITTRARVKLVIFSAIQAIIASRANSTALLLTYGSLNYAEHSARAFALNSTDAIAPLRASVVYAEFTARGAQIAIFAYDTLLETPVAVRALWALH